MSLKVSSRLVAKTVTIYANILVWYTVLMGKVNITISIASWERNKNIRSFCIVKLTWENMSKYVGIMAVLKRATFPNSLSVSLETEAIQQLTKITQHIIINKSLSKAFYQSSRSKIILFVASSLKLCHSYN